MPNEQSASKEEDLSRKDLEEYYEKVLSCNTCGKSYGSDVIKEDGYCPNCKWGFSGRQSRHKRIDKRRLERSCVDMGGTHTKSST